jgi:hypothetical protein
VLTINKNLIYYLLKLWFDFKVLQLIILLRVMFKITFLSYNYLIMLMCQFQSTFRSIIVKKKKKKRLKHLIGTCSLEILFFAPSLSFVSQMITIVWEKTDLVPPSIFPSNI